MLSAIATRKTVCFSFLIGLAALCFAAAAQAEALRVSRVLSDGAVLQRDAAVTVRGFAAAGEKVTVSFAEQTRTATADGEGQWSVQLDPMAASAQGRVLTCKAGDGQSVVLKDIVVGDVILFAQQRLIDTALASTKAGQAAAKNAKANAGFRVMRIEPMASTTPLPDLAAEATDGWQVVDSEAAGAMSAAAYYFGRDLAEWVGVPVGIVDLNMGPNFTIAWLDVETLLGSNEYYGEKRHITGYTTGMLESAERYAAQQGKTKQEVGRDWVESDPTVDPLFPAVGYNAVLHPMRGLTLKAVVLQLGNDYPYMGYERLREQGKMFDRPALDEAWWENYINRKRGYRAVIDVLPRVPAVWRGYFGDSDLPIGLITTPNSANPTYAIHNRETRELHRRTADGSAGVGVILPGGEHIPFSGQPADQRLVAQRSLAWVIGSAYDKDTAATGPMLDRVEVNYGEAQVFFKEGTAQGLTAGPGSLDHFEVTGADRVYHPVKATIDGNTIRLSTDAVSRIEDVRYNYRLHPDQGLTNAAGLPAMPFVTGEHTYVDVPRYQEQSLPEEYTTPASEWEGGEIAIVSGGGADYRNGPGWLGATGLRVLPFGPNMNVRQVLPGSPADGKVQVGDMIYKVNGELLEQDHLPHVGRAVALAESNEGRGEISFSLRRGNELLDTTLQLEVLGSYSVTSPYDCPKTDRIVANSEAYLAERGGLSTDYAGGGWLMSEPMFLLAAGTPRHQGLVRRFVYKLAHTIEERGAVPGNAWHRGHGALLLAEYYLATGDQNILPALKAYCDAVADMQARPGTFEGMEPRSIGGWRHNYPGGQWYGMIPVIGLPAMMGMHLADEAGVDINDEAYARGLKFFTDGQAEMGWVDYAGVMPDRKAPDALDPEKMMQGMAYSRNGGRGMTAALFMLEGDTRITHLNSLYTAFAWNNCNEGHGSNFTNGLWTPVGAHLHGKKAFVNFMRNHYWFRDLKRMYTHTSIPARGDAPSVGHDLALVIPRQRLQIIGAPESVFAGNAPAVLGPALAAYHGRDYARAEKIVHDLLAGGSLLSDDRGKAEQLHRAAVEMQQSIEADMTRMQALLDAGKVYEASLDLRQLKAVVPENDARLADLEEVITGADRTVMRDDKQRYDKLQKSLTLNYREPSSDANQDIDWQSLHRGHRQPQADDDQRPGPRARRHRLAGQHP